MDSVMLGMVSAAVAAPCFTFLTYWIGKDERERKLDIDEQRLELEEKHLKGKADLAEFQETKKHVGILENHVKTLREENEDCEAHLHQLRLAIIKAGIQLEKE